MSFDPSVSTFNVVMPVTPPMQAPMGAMVATGRGLTAPIPIPMGPQTNTNLTAAQYTAVAAEIALLGLTGPSSTAGTVIATWPGADLVPWDGSVAAARASNLPSSPNRAYPVTGAPFPDGFNTSIYQTFTVPGNLRASGIVLQLSLCLDPNSNNVDPSGNAAAFGAAFAPLTSASTLDDTALPADAIQPTGPLPTVAGNFVQMTFAANGSLSPGNLHLLRLTRRTDTVLDKNMGRLLLISLSLLTS